MKLRYGVLFVLALVANAVFASSASADQISERTIEQLHVNTTGGVYFKTYESMPDPDACTYASLYRVPGSATFAKEVYALLLAARSAGTKVTFFIDGCEGTYPKVIWARSVD